MLQQSSLQELSGLQSFQSPYQQSGEAVREMKDSYAKDPPVAAKKPPECTAPTPPAVVQPRYRALSFIGQHRLGLLDRAGGALVVASGETNWSGNRGHAHGAISSETMRDVASSKRRSNGPAQLGDQEEFDYDPT